MASRILKTKGGVASAYEKEVAQALESIASGSSSVASAVKDLSIVAAEKVQAAGKSATVITVPYKQMKIVKANHSALVEELEKKLSNTTVVFIAKRATLTASFTRNVAVRAGTPRPNSRTLKAVQEAMLDDLVFPSEISGKRTRYKVDGSKLMRVFLDSNEAEKTESRLEAYSAAYNKLTGKKVVFELPVN